MTLTSNVTIVSDVTKHRAFTINAGAGQPENWLVSWLPDWVLTRELAATAMNIAELVGSHFTAHENGIDELPNWAAQLGLAPNDAVKRLTDRHSWGLAVRCSDLPWQHKALLLLLGTHIHTNSVYHPPTLADLADVTGHPEQYLVDMLFDLQGQGWFSWHAVNGAGDITTAPPEPEPSGPEPAPALAK